MSKNDAFVTGKPKSEVLKPYIAYYYFDKKKKGESKKYIYHPHTRRAITVYKNSRIEFNGNTSRSIPDASQKYFSAFAHTEPSSKHVEMLTPYNKIGIAFEPLGINHFIPENLIDVVGSLEDLKFPYFDEKMEECLDRVFTYKEVDKKIECLDNFFEMQFCGFQQTQIIKAVKILLNSNKKYFVQDLANELNVGRKTLLRLFKTHLCCSVKDFIDIVQFRKAVAAYQTHIDKPQLTSLAYETDYYDQSEFINHFKKITGFNPKNFFNGIVHLGKEDTYWTLVSK